MDFQSRHGIELQVEGKPQAPVVVMLHGWPDTLALWDDTVLGLRADFRCVRFTLPGFASALPARPTSLASMSEALADVVKHTSPDAPVILLAHDWGCVYAFEFAARFPALVSRFIAVDIGDHNQEACLQSLSMAQRLMVAVYQLWLAAAWTIGGPVGTALSRIMARASDYRGDLSAISWKMNYPYAMRWFGLAGGFDSAAKVTLTHPMLFLYGEKKPFMFHSQQFLDELARTPGSAGQGFPCGHWIMVERGPEMLAAVRTWLAAPVRDV